MNSLPRDLADLHDEKVGDQPGFTFQALSPGEPGRLEALQRYSILDTAPEASFDRITRLVATAFRISIVRLTFKNTV